MLSMNISECLEKYKEITLKLIDETNNGEELEELLNERTEVLDKIGEIEFLKEEFKEKVEILNILELDDKLQKLVEAEKVKIKNQIDVLRKTREARKNYNKIQGELRLFSAKG